MGRMLGLGIDSKEGTICFSMRLGEKKQALGKQSLLLAHSFTKVLLSENPAAVGGIVLMHISHPKA